MMKNFFRIALMIALVLCIAVAVVACNETETTNAPAAKTEAPAAKTEAPAAKTEAPAATEAPAVTTAAPVVTTAAPVVTEAPVTTADGPALEDGEFVIGNSTLNESGNTDDLIARTVWGEFEVDENGNTILTDNSCMAMVTNDTMRSGTIKAKITSKEGSAANDNGIVFGICRDEEDPDSPYWWENSAGPAYYFCFVNDAGGMHLAKVDNYDGGVWHNLVVTETAFEGYTHGDTFDIQVDFDLETGEITCYFNGNVAIEYVDEAPLTGDGYGIRAETQDVTYHSVEITHD